MPVPGVAGAVGGGGGGAGALLVRELHDGEQGQLPCTQWTPAVSKYQTLSLNCVSLTVVVGPGLVAGSHQGGGDQGGQGEGAVRGPRHGGDWGERGGGPGVYIPVTLSRGTWPLDTRGRV